MLWRFALLLYLTGMPRGPRGTVGEEQYIQLGSNMTSPPACGVNHTCDCHQTKHTFFLVDCSKRNLPAVPEKIPANVTKLDLSSNLLREIPQDSLQDTLNLTDVVFEKNQITSIPPKLLSAVTNLQSFYFAKNWLRAIPPDLYQTNTDLRKVDFTRNKITEIPESLFSQTPKITVIKFPKNHITVFPVRLLKNGANVETIDFSENYIAEFGNEILWNKTRLKTLALRHNRIETLSPDLFVHTVLLESVDFDYNHLTEIPSNLFCNTPALKRVSFAGNRISQIPADMLSSADQIKVISMPSNKISELPHNFFRRLLLLEHIDFRDNLLTVVPCDSFTGLHNFRYIDLSNNRIPHLCPEIFNSLQKVTQIHLNGNELDEVLENMFWTTKALQILTLSKNKIHTLPEKLLTNLHNLTKIEMAHIPVEMISEDFFEQTPHILTINLRGCMLTRIPKMLFHHSKELDDKILLSRNRVTSLDEATFYWNPNVTEIDISFNLIENLPAGLFSQNVNLLGLNLSGNRLRTLPKKLLQNNHKLCRLYLSDNFLSELPAGFLKENPILYYLSLANNSMHQVKTTFFDGIENLAYLSLANNNISDLPFDLFRNLSVSYCIDLSSNNLKEMPSGMFDTGSKDHDTKFLQLHRNNLTRVQSGFFRGLSKLKIVFLNNNRISTLDNDSFRNMNFDDIFLFNNNLTELWNTSFISNRTKQLPSRLHVYKNRVEHISPEAIDLLPSKMDLLLSCEYLKNLPQANRTSQCVSRDYVPTLMLKKNILYEVLRHQGFDCTQLEFKQVICRPCPSGSYGDESGHCSPCPAGGFYQDDIGTTWCNQCYIGSFVKHGNASSIMYCKVCPEGTNQSTFAGYRACPCKANYTRLDRFEKCSLCLDEGLDCSKDYKALKPGYYWNWTFPYASLEEYSNFVVNLQTENSYYDKTTTNYTKLIPRTFACSRPESCINNYNHDVNGIAGTCAEGYRGWLCSKCLDGYYSALGFCLSCPNAVIVVFEITIIVFAIIAFFILVIVKRQDRCVNDRPSADIVSSRVKIVLGFYQVIGELFEAFHGVSWAGALQYIGELIAVLKFNILRLIVRPHCLNEKLSLDPKRQFIVSLIFPLVVVFIAFMIQQLCRVYFKFKKRYNDAQLHSKLGHTKSTLATYVLLLLFVTYPPTCDIIFSLYPGACDTFEIYNDGNITISLLRADYDIVCEDLTYYQIAAFIATGLYVLSFPLFLFAVLRKYNRLRPTAESIADHECSGGDNSVDDTFPSLDSRHLVNDTPSVSCSENKAGEAVPVWLNFLCENFKPRFWFWEILELARKVMQTMLVTLLGWSNPLTKLTAIGVSVLFLTLHVKFSPMKHRFEQRLQLFSLAVIFVNVLVAAVPMSGDYGNVIAVAIITLDVAIIVIVSGEALLSAYRFIKRKFQEHHFAKYLI